MEHRITFVTLGVRDLSRARAFYCGTLGLTPLASPPEVVFIQMGPTRLALWGRDDLASDSGCSLEGNGTPPFALAHNVRSPAEVDALLATAAAGGGRLVKAGQPTFWGGYAGYFADPEGFLWEVAWNPALPLSAPEER